jgi:hypothetical protein
MFLEFFRKFFVPREVSRTGDFDLAFGFTNLPKPQGSDRAEIRSIY